LSVDVVACSATREREQEKSFVCEFGEYKRICGWFGWWFGEERENEGDERLLLLLLA
jgi:hypothetical protein